MRRELAWGMPIHDPDMRSRRSTLRNSRGVRSPPSTPRVVGAPNAYTSALQQSARALGAALLDATNCVERTVILAFHQTAPPAQLYIWTAGPGSRSGTTTPNVTPSLGSKGGPHGWTLSQLCALTQADDQLKTARDDMREDLKRVFNEIDLQQRESDSDPHLSKDAQHCSLAMVALLQMAQEVRLALQVAQRFAIQYDGSSARMWFPRVSLSWLGVPPGAFVYDDPNAVFSVYSTASDDTLSVTDHGASPEWKQGIREVHSVHVRRAALKAARLSVSTKDERESGTLGTNWWRKLVEAIDDAWSSRRALRFRLRLWKFLKAVSHSSHLRHALKNASGVALLTFPAFMPANSAGTRIVYRVFSVTEKRCRAQMVHKRSRTMDDYQVG